MKDIQRLDENGKVRQEFYEYALQCCKDGIEIWADVDGYEGYYQVSNFGRFKSLSRKHWNGFGYWNSKELFINHSIVGHGYIEYKLHKNNKYKCFRLHRLEGIAFIPNPENKPEINHKNGNKLYNLLINIEWSTKSENMLHAYKTGLKKSNMLGRIGNMNIRSVGVLQFDLNLNLLNSFESIRQASISTGCNACNISKNAKGKFKTSKKYIWRFK